MRSYKDKNYKKIIIVISLPILFIAQYYFFKIGFFRPMIKGAEIEIVDGDYIRDIDKFVIKLDETVTISGGEYIMIPPYSKEPNIWFKILDNNGVLEIIGNKLIAKHEGISSVAIMKNSRVLKKADIKVVDPKIKSLDVKIDNKLVYVGDKATITSDIEVDYDKFKNKEEVTYESMNKEVIKITDNKIEAVGVGRGKILVKAKNKEKEFSYNISAKVAKIDIGDILELEEGQHKKLEPIIQTSPAGLKHPKIKYELLNSKLPIQRVIDIDINGNVVAIREGSEKVKITCGNKIKIITINVVKESITNNNITNLTSSSEVIDGKLRITLEWDYLKGVYDYDIFLKNDSLSEKEFNLYQSFVVEKDYTNNRISTTIEVELIDNDIPNLSIYVVGKTSVGTTNKSNTIIIKPEFNIQNVSVKNLNYNLDSENKIVTVTWRDLGEENITYSIYAKDNTLGESGFKLLQNSIQDNKFTFSFEDEYLDLEIYILANKNDKYSKQSDIINIKK